MLPLPGSMYAYASDDATVPIKKILAITGKITFFNETDFYQIIFNYTGAPNLDRKILVYPSHQKIILILRYFFGYH